MTAKDDPFNYFGVEQPKMYAVLKENCVHSYQFKHWFYTNTQPATNTFECKHCGDVLEQPVGADWPK